MDGGRDCQLALLCNVSVTVYDCQLALLCNVSVTVYRVSL
jgi:hypothetical protein